MPPDRGADASDHLVTSCQIRSRGRGFGIPDSSRQTGVARWSVVGMHVPGQQPVRSGVVEGELWHLRG